MTTVRPAVTPINMNVNLTSKQYDDHINQQQAEVVDDPLIDQTKYQREIGKLLYLNMIRPDISFIAQNLS